MILRMSRLRKEHKIEIKKRIVSRADVYSRRTRATTEGMIQLPKVSTKLAERTTEMLRHGTGSSLGLNRSVTVRDFTQWWSGVLWCCLPNFYFAWFCSCFYRFIMYETCMTWLPGSILRGLWINICIRICIKGRVTPHHLFPSSERGMHIHCLIRMHERCVLRLVARTSPD